MSGVRGTEIMATAGAREIRDGEVVVVGIGLPWIACRLAQRTHAPRLTFLLEIGVMDAEPRDTPVGVADPRNFLSRNCLDQFPRRHGYEPAPRRC
jgi:glutaconate CoA-transferase subunit B